MGGTRKEQGRREPWRGGKLVNLGYVLSVGRERRDYATLVRAVSSPGANVPTIIVASSPWSRSRSAGSGVDGVTAPPANVSWQGGLRFTELRDLYEKAALVVVPLEPGTEYAAGSTGLMEAMAMSKAVVVTDTPGIADYVSPGKTARVVPGGDPTALREAITHLLANPAEASASAPKRGRTFCVSGRSTAT
jgi:glycosyltransferase involved in cell wall biosynthesis